MNTKKNKTVKKKVDINALLRKFHKKNQFTRSKRSNNSKIHGGKILAPPNYGLLDVELWGTQYLVYYNIFIR